MIKFSNITKKYTQKDTVFTALDNVDLEFRANQITAIVGRSGAGKSSLLRLINLLDRPNSGEIYIDNQAITALTQIGLAPIRQQIGMVFQQYHLLNNLSVFDNIALPLRIAGTDENKIQNRVNNLLQLVGLDLFGNKYPAQLSGGQKQRVAIARALATEPKILLFDEATAALDPETTQKILKLLRKIQIQLKLTIVFVSHEIDFVKGLADHIVLIDSGRIVESKEKLDFFLKPESALAKEYVYANLMHSINQPYESTKKSHHDETLIRLTFNERATDQPVMARLTYETKILYSIVAAEVDSLGATQVGHMILSLADQDVEKAIAYFDSKQLRHEVIGYV